MTQRFEGEVHALRAENAALRAEIAALLAASGAPRSSAAPNNAADAADPPLLGSVPPSPPPAFPDHLRTWESPSGADDVLTGADLERYARHVALPSFGAAKQAALARAKVLIVGVGGLGSPAALYLAAAGVGRLALADADHVEVSNLHRQIIHGERSRGVPKAVSAQTALRGLNSRCVVETHLDGFRDENALELVADCDCVLDCTDNVRTRYLISDACALAGVPLVAAAAVGLEGQLTVYCRARAPESAANEKKSSTRDHPPPRPSGDDTPCYRCVFPTPPARRDCASCAAAGVLGPVPGIMGVLQALEAIKALAGLGDGAAGRMLCFDAAGRAGQILPRVRAQAEEPDVRRVRGRRRSARREEDHPGDARERRRPDRVRGEERQSRGGRRKREDDARFRRGETVETPNAAAPEERSDSRREDLLLPVPGGRGPRGVRGARRCAGRREVRGRAEPRPGPRLSRRRRRFPRGGRPRRGGEARGSFPRKEKRRASLRGRRRLGRAAARRGVVSSPRRARLLREAPSVGVRARPEPRLALGAQGGAGGFDARGRFVDRPERRYGRRRE
jgi:adenylyltransferase/sulfurtransferase